MSNKKVMKLASRSKRFGAGIIDAVIPFVAYLVLSVYLPPTGSTAIHRITAMAMDTDTDMDLTTDTTTEAG